MHNSNAFKKNNLGMGNILSKVKSQIALQWLKEMMKY